jgi:hypothetical protein
VDVVAVTCVELLEIKGRDMWRFLCLSVCDMWRFHCLSVCLSGKESLCARVGMLSVICRAFSVCLSVCLSDLNGRDMCVGVWVCFVCAYRYSDMWRFQCVHVCVYIHTHIYI